MKLTQAVLFGLLGVTASVAAANHAFAADPPAATDAAQPAAAALPGQPTSAFDPARHMRIAEVKPGMQGYGLSVFSGTKVERFEVEVISVLKNFNPKADVILIKCRGQNLEHTGAVAGMSGSPIYLKDDSGKERMIGAFAYGWPLSKDPVAGVQPIEYMLSIPTAAPTKPNPGGSDKPVAGSGDAAQKPAGAEPRGTWSMQDALNNWERYANPAQSQHGAQGLGVAPDSKTNAPASALRMRPLATPLMTGGWDPLESTCRHASLSIL